MPADGGSRFLQFWRGNAYLVERLAAAPTASRNDSTPRWGLGWVIHRQRPRADDIRLMGCFPSFFPLRRVDIPEEPGRLYRMRPVDMTPLGTELAIKWDDGAESFVPLETLRRFCPCASCMGEKDILGNTYRPPTRPYGPNAFQLVRLSPVGAYGVQPAWADGHGTGIYSWDYLRRLAEAPAAPES